MTKVKTLIIRSPEKVKANTQQKEPSTKRPESDHSKVTIPYKYI